MKAFKKTLALFLATLMIVSAFSLYSVFAVTNGDDAVPESGMVTTNTPTLLGGTATASEPVPMSNTGTATANWAEETRNGVTAFYVDDLDDFKAFHDNAATNTYYKGKTVILTNDLDMAEANWAWTQVSYFDGTFDGQEHIIRNLETTSSMFNRTNNGTADNRNEVEIKNISFVGGGVDASATNNIAFLIFQPGSYCDVVFNNVHTDVTVKGKVNTAVFISRQNNTSVTVKIENCTNDSDVTGTTEKTGGYVAWPTAGNSVEIINSTFTGTITCGYATDAAKGNLSRGAGFVAFNQGTLILNGCTFGGTISSVVENSEGAVIGGLIGSMASGSATLTKCKVTGTINAGKRLQSGYYYSESGGFVGTIEGGTVSFEGCSFTGNVNGGGTAIGGIVGELESGSVAMNNCYFGGEVNSSNTQVGGAIGLITGNTSATFTKCVSAAKVATTGSDSSGGFVGRSNANATVSLTDCASFADMTDGKKYSSAFLGNLQCGATFTRCLDAAKESTVTSSYGGLFFTVNSTTKNTTITLTDCYAATNACGAYMQHSSDKSHTVVGGSSVVSIANSEGSSLSAANFKAVCPELAANGWVATTNTVTYADGLTVPEILPATVATMLGRTVAASPVNAEQWHVKDNGETVDVRFIGSIKEDEAFLAKYDNVGIQITVVLKDTEDQTLIDAKKYNSTSVYTTVNTDASGVPAFVAEDGTYLFTANMRGFLKSATYEVTFVAFATYGGVDIFDYDGATTVTVTNGAIAE